MTLLADSQIRNLCTPPNFVITTNVPGNNPNHGVYNFPSQIETFSYLTENEIKFKIRMSNAALHGQNTIGVVSYRSLTKEELDNFKPMISPFVDGQVRTRLRNPTASELQMWEQARHSGDVPEHFVSDNVDVGLQIKEKVISYGLSSSGYDLRIAPEFKIFSNINSVVVDPKNFNLDSFVDFNGHEVIIPPNSFVLARSLERFIMPRDVCAIVVGKSTLARVGINCLCTPLENSWEGYLTLEFANVTSLPVKLYANEGGCQVMFFKNSIAPDISYSDRSGKYSNQDAEITLPRV